MKKQKKSSKKVKKKEKPKKSEESELEDNIKEAEEEIETDELQDFFQQQIQLPKETTSVLERIQISDDLEESVASVPIRKEISSKKYDDSKYDNKYGENKYGEKTPDYVSGEKTEKGKETKSKGEIN